MPKDVEHLKCDVMTSDRDLMFITKESIQDITRLRLIERLAEYITDHFDELPITIRETSRIEICATETSMSLILIGHEEYIRLVGIEAAYYSEHPELLLQKVNLIKHT